MATSTLAVCPTAKKQGPGLYVYADGSGFKGAWDNDALDGHPHPVDPASDSEDARRLHELNLKNCEAVANLKTKMGGERRASPPPQISNVQD